MKSLHWIKTSSATRYILIGGSAFVLDFSLLQLGLAVGLTLLLANGIAVTAGILYSFIMHRTFTFAHKAQGEGYKRSREHQFIIFLIISISALLLSEILIHFFVTQAHFNTSVAKVLTSAILFVWNYTFNRLITFRTR